MAYTATYASLCADIIQMTEDDSEDLRVNLTNIIQLAESRVLKDLDIKYARQEVAVGSTAASSRTIARPDTILETDSLWVTVAGTKTALQHRSYDFCNSYHPAVATESVPTMYAETEFDEYYLAPTPDAAYVITAFGLVRPAAMSPTNQTTWVGTNYGSLLLLACLVVAEKFLSNPSQVEQWKSEYNEQLIASRRELGLDTSPSDPQPAVLANNNEAA